MLNLFDRSTELTTARISIVGLAESAQRESNRMAHTTAGQLLFLVESPDSLDIRPETLALARTIEVAE